MARFECSCVGLASIVSKKGYLKNPNETFRFDGETEKGLDNLSKTNKRRNSPSSDLDR